MRKIFKQSKWHYRNNLTRKNKTKKVNKHPSLVVGEKDNAFINIGLTHSEKRGHHKNIEIHDPINFRNKSYLRDDVKETDKKYMKEILITYRISKKDISKIMKIISKYEKKPPSGGSH